MFSGMLGPFPWSASVDLPEMSPRGGGEPEGESAKASVVDDAMAWDLLRALASAEEGRALVAKGSARLRARPPDGWQTSPPPTESARELLDLFSPLVVPSAVVVGQLAQSLDGRIATESGHSHYVSGSEDIRRLHRLRALADAVVVGAGTVASDDPRLTVREVPGEDPVRVVLDPEGRLSPDHRVFADSGGRTLVVERGEPGRSGRQWPHEGVESLALPADTRAGFSPEAVVGMLRQRGMRRILVEGGGVTVSRFLEAGTLDRLHLTVAPLIIGSGRPSLSLSPIETLESALRPPCRIFRLGSDVLFDLDLRDASSSRG